MQKADVRALASAMLRLYGATGATASSQRYAQECEQNHDAPGHADWVAVIELLDDMIGCGKPPIITTPPPAISSPRLEPQPGRVIEKPPRINVRV